ncbi:MAG: hypothetical protein GYA02_11220 [Clostridiaceae bacterium]|nr:hypothetical protein [Clostridiaceae bacterium]
MIRKYPPINEKCVHMLHSGDYNPDQWKNTPEIWDEDMRLTKLAHCNAMSVGIFAWAALEPEVGRFEFGWLDEIMDKLAKNGAYAVLATPSGARPAWMSAKYPVKDNIPFSLVVELSVAFLQIFLSIQRQASVHISKI